MRRFIRPAALSIGLLAPAAALAFDLSDLFDLEDQLRARELNVLADNAQIEDGAPGAVVMFGAGWVRRDSNCLIGADCSRQPVTTGNYLRIEGRAPWVVYMGYAGLVQNRSRLHEKGDITAMNMIDVPPEAIRPGGLHIRVFSAGGVTQHIRR